MSVFYIHLFVHRLLSTISAAFLPWVFSSSLLTSSLSLTHSFPSLSHSFPSNISFTHSLSRSTFLCRYVFTDLSFYSISFSYLSLALSFLYIPCFSALNTFFLSIFQFHHFDVLLLLCFLLLFPSVISDMPYLPFPLFFLYHSFACYIFLLVFLHPRSLYRFLDDAFLLS